MISEELEYFSQNSRYDKKNWTHRLLNKRDEAVAGTQSLESEHEDPKDANSANRGAHTAAMFTSSGAPSSESDSASTTNFRAALPMSTTTQTRRR